MMIEDEIFKRSQVRTDTLIPYGFHQKPHFYEYAVRFMDDFSAHILIDHHGMVLGKVYDIRTAEEYVLFRMANQTGEFVNRVREEYIQLLTDIRTHCFKRIEFMSEQANRITKRIIAMYHNEPEFMWDKFPGYGVFRNPDNKKWYGMIFNIDKHKLDQTKSGEIEVINVKGDPDEIPFLFKREGFYPAYRMNKKSWITICLDHTLTDDEIMKYVENSHQLTDAINEWIIPFSPDELPHCIDDSDQIIVKQPGKIKIKDRVFCYASQPCAAILYQGEVIAIDRSDQDQPLISIKLFKAYDRHQYPFSRLQEYGLKTLHKTRSVPQKLRKALNDQQKNN